MNLHIARSIQEYVKVITRINPHGIEKWFRGQSRSEYRLTPSALRQVFAIRDRRGNKITPPEPDNLCSGSNNIVAFLPVDKMVLEFKKNAERYIEYNASTMIEWECIAQHYGIPTRVLDWSSNAINALFFAVEDCSIGKPKKDDIEEFYSSYGFSNGGGAVFSIDPLEINKITVPIKGFGNNPTILDAIDDAQVIDYCLHNSIPPVCFSGFNKEKRIARQSGKFSTTGTLLWPLDFYEIIQNKIDKIFIPFSSYNKIRCQLRSLGITHNNIYVENDEKDKIAKSIADKTRRRFIKEMTSK